MILLRRLALMKGRTLFEIMTSDYYDPDSIHTPHDLRSWPILEARGIPNCGCRWEIIFTFFKCIGA